MAIKYLKADQLPAFLAHLAEKARVVAPVKTDGVVQYEVWEPGKEVELDVLLAKQSPKEWVFPQCEAFLKFEYRMEEPDEAAIAASAPTGAAEDGADEGAAPTVVIPHETVDVQPVSEAPAQVIFGLRPCDARGFVQMDNVFGGYGGFYFDPLYNARREATTLLAVTCRDPRSTCFCTAIGGSPAGTEGVDALFTQVDGGFTVEALTEKGEAALAAAGLTDAGDAQSAEAAEVKDAAAATGRRSLRAGWHTRESARQHRGQAVARPGHALHLLRHLHVRLSQLLLLQHQRRTGRDARRALPHLGQLLQPPLHRGDFGPQPAGAEVQPLPQSLQPQVLVLPRQVRQPAVLRLRALHHALPHAHRYPRGAAGDGLAGCAGAGGDRRCARRDRREGGVDG